VTTIMGLLNQISEGEVVLPAIQRDFVWDEDQTESLLDSVMRGYPIGIALLWETYNDIQYRTFEKNFREGTLHTFHDNTQHRRLRIVLDGQQRLQSLYVALHGKRDGRRLYFDVLSGQRWDDTEELRYLFEFRTAKEAKDANKDTTAEAKDRPEDETPFWWISASELFSMPTRDRRDLIRRLTESLKLSDEDNIQLEENFAIFDEAFTRNEGILKLSTIDENLPANSAQRNPSGSTRPSNGLSVSRYLLSGCPGGPERRQTFPVPPRSMGHPFWEAPSIRPLAPYRRALSLALVADHPEGWALHAIAAL
jgi:Protein of unknown function DUF262